MNCVFCEVVAGAVLAEIVWRGEDAIAFLDNRPLFPGHVLLVPVKHIVTLADLPAADVGAFFQIAQRLERAVERAMGAEGTFIAINNTVSQSVPHLHVHVVPRRKGDGLKGFFWPRHKYEGEEQMREAADKIRALMDTRR